jgi:hypothetical protein
MRLMSGHAHRFATYLIRESDRYYEQGKFAGGKELADAANTIVDGEELSPSLILHYKRFMNLLYG